MIEALIVLASFGVIYISAVRMVQANRIYTKSVKEIEVLASIPKELARNKSSLEKQIADLNELTARSKNLTERMKAEQTELIDELDRLRNRSRDKLFVMERVMQPGQTLWEVQVSNDSLFRGLAHEEVRLSWAQGRRYLVSSPSERDAKRRAELRFLAGQGYRVLQVQKSTHF